jgi:siroheme synthase
MVNETIALFEPITKLTSNAISMVFAYDVYGKDTKSWAPPKTERNGLWERNEAGGDSTVSFKGGVPKTYSLSSETLNVVRADLSVTVEVVRGQSSRVGV